MIPEGTDNHILDSKADAENEDYKYQAKALSAIKKGLEINLTETMNELSYWKQRCEAAENGLRNLIFTAQKLWDDAKPIKDTGIMIATHPTIEEAKQILNK